MMTIEKLRESMKDPIVKDRALVRKAIEEMAQLPTAKWCKASVILTKSKEKLGTHILKNVADALGILPQDERIDTLGKLAGVDGRGHALADFPVLDQNRPEVEGVDDFMFFHQFVDVFLPGGCQAMEVAVFIDQANLSVADPLIDEQIVSVPASVIIIYSHNPLALLRRKKQ